MAADIPFISHRLYSLVSVLRCAANTVVLFSRSGWASVWDENHRAFYYHNLATDETTWEPPVAPLVVSSPPQPAAVTAVAAGETTTGAPSTSSSSPPYSSSAVATTVSADVGDSKTADKERAAEEDPAKPRKRSRKSKAAALGERDSAVAEAPRKEAATKTPTGSEAAATSEILDGGVSVAGLTADPVAMTAESSAAEPIPRCGYERSK